MAPDDKDGRQVANIIVESLIAAGVRVCFGIPGAKVDALFNELIDHPDIQLIICRHEQNAAMMAAAVGRISGTPGVCIATSGPGAGNLTTGLVTATTEGDPVVALIGSVPRVQNTKRTHQSMKALEILGPVSKTAVNIDVPDQAAEVVLSAFRTASTYPKGSCTVSIPMDVASSTTKIVEFPSAAFTPPPAGPAPVASIRQLARMIEQAKLPIFFLGMRSSAPKVVNAVRHFLTKCPLPTIETFQAAGAIPETMVNLFYGRVGLFRNQVGDRLLAKSDLVITVGYEPTEYDASAWNAGRKTSIVHIDYNSCDYGAYYQPKLELLGSIYETLNQLAHEINSTNSPNDSEICRTLTKEYNAWQDDNDRVRRSSGRVHPLHFITLLQRYVSKDTTVTCDVGTVFIWLMRHFFAYEPRRLLCSNGQQTLGVGLPWAIAASLIQDPPCSQKVVSLSGDGGFMFSSQEMSTAALQKCNITHFIWNDEAYNMVQFQEEMKYGRSAGIKLGGIDFVKFAESFGAKGFRVSDSSHLESVMAEALAYQGVALVDVAIDYSDVHELAQHVIPEDFN